MVHSCRSSISWQISSLGRSTLSFPHLTDLLFVEQRPPISSSRKVTFLCRKIHVRSVVASKVIIYESRGEVSPVDKDTIDCVYLTVDIENSWYPLDMHFYPRKPRNRLKIPLSPGNGNLPFPYPLIPRGSFLVGNWHPYLCLGNFFVRTLQYFFLPMKT